MGAVAENQDPGEAAVKAVEAGADLILMPADFESAYQAVLSAAEEGRISKERISRSAERIVRCKLEMEEKR